ncbi:MAG: hypothetical protein JOY71_09945 [Acetobacteraceae bacterium]|nr:hypothetical protein [Acetobacteraceae bacterium]MBV8522427.1 hypothetical protein [Acetobacteraceae bacterium]MBV8591162.1 hypothetical protein [Acetobacteraceae bacterium]
MALSTIDHEIIRRWAEGKGGKPAAVDRTHQGGDVGIIRIMFPDNPQSEHQSLVEISWDEFFRQFEESKLALLYEEDSLFSKVVGRDTLERRAHGEHVSRHHGGSAHSDQSDRARSHPGAGSHTDSASADGDSADLKSREYRDKDGKIHHHTKGYVKRHADDT